MYGTMNPVMPTKWGARIDYAANTFGKGVWKPDKYIIHYGGGVNKAGAAPFSEGNEVAVLRSWERYHIDTKKWRGIAYNYAIGQTGTLYHLRGEKQAAATSGDYEGDGIPENQEGRAVAFILGGSQQPTPAALATFKAMWVIDPRPVIGHKDVKATLCPGEALYTFIRKGQFMPDTTGTVTPAPPAATTEGERVLRHASVTVRQMQEWAVKRGASTRFIELAPVAFDESVRIGVDPAITYGIMAHETGFGWFGGVLTADWKNWGGIKTTSGGSNDDPNAHQRFPSDRVGVRAVAQHAGLYGGLRVPADEVVDPRHFDWIRGKAPFIPSEGWTWAGSTHAPKVVSFVKEMRNV